MTQYVGNPKKKKKRFYELEIFYMNYSILKKKKNNKNYLLTT